MATGIVKWFNDDKAYGLLTRQDGKDDIIVHCSAIQHDGYRRLYEGDEVEFQPQQGTWSPHASKVIITKPSPIRWLYS